MNDTEQAVIDIYKAWAFDAQAVGPFLVPLFEALKAFDEQRAEQRADTAFGNGINASRDIRQSLA